MRAIPEGEKVVGERQGRREDFRRQFASETQPILAECITRAGRFRAQVINLSARGVLLRADPAPAVGEEIALSIPLVRSQAMLRATGEVIRLDPRGVAVIFRVLFNY